MTLAVLHDSGWYNVDFSKASPDYTWGKGLGCDFVKTSCYQYMKNKPKIQPFCQSKSKFPTPRYIQSLILHLFYDNATGNWSLVNVVLTKLSSAT